MNRRAVVTGGAGFVGSHLCETLTERGWEVVSLDDYSTGDSSNQARAREKGIRTVEVDITGPELKRIVAQAAPEVVFHLAAIASVRLCEDDPSRCREVNVEGTTRVLESAIGSGAAKLVNISSLAVHEAGSAGAGRCYGRSKLESENHVGRAATAAGIGWVTLRPANIYGPRQSGDGESAVVATWLQQMAKGEALYIDGDGLQTRDFLYVTDAVEAMVVAAHRADGVAIDVGGGVETSLLDLLEAMKVITGWEGGIHHRPARPGDIRRSVVDPHPAQTALGWGARIDLATGLQRTWEWTRGLRSSTPRDSAS